MQKFKDKALGDVTELTQFETTLKKSIGNKFEEIKENLEEKLKVNRSDSWLNLIFPIQSQCEEFLGRKIDEIEENIRNNKYSKIVDVKSDMQSLKENFMKYAPQSREKEKIFSVAYDKMIVNAADYITRNTENAIQMQTKYAFIF